MRKIKKNLPLQPDRMSMPCTCPHSDWLMYVLYGCDSEFMGQVIRSAAAGIEAEHDTPGVREALKLFLPSQNDCMHSLRIKLLVLLDRDEGTRRRLCEYTSTAVQRYSKVCPEKASRFYVELHERLLPDWVKDETISSGEFVDRVRMAYLIS